MKKSRTRSLVQGVCVVAVLAAIAIPLTGLMVAQSPVVVPSNGISQAAEVNEVSQVASAEASSAVSALMAGSAVGPPRAARVSPRHPATAFIP